MSGTVSRAAARAAAPIRGWTGAAAGHGHTAVPYESAEVLHAATTPFLEAGLQAGDLVVLACAPEVADLVCAPLGQRAAAVERDTRMCLLDTRAADAFVAVRRALQRAARTPSGRVRLVGQVGIDATPGGAREYLRYEIATNAVLAGAAMSVMCLLDTRALPDELLGRVIDAHPQVAVGDGLADNPGFREPGSYLRSLPVPREPLENAVPVLAIDGATVLAQLRDQLRRALASVVPRREQAEDLHLAVSEVAANAFRHGRPPVSARLWADDRRVVCTISDSGRGLDDPLAGYQPAHGTDLAHGGMGLWLARKLWDSVDLLPGGPGLTARLSTALVPSPRRAGADRA